MYMQVSSRCGVFASRLHAGTSRTGRLQKILEASSRARRHRLPRPVHRNARPVRPPQGSFLQVFLHRFNIGVLAFETDSNAKCAPFVGVASNAKCAPFIEAVSKAKCTRFIGAFSHAKGTAITGAVLHAKCAPFIGAKCARFVGGVPQRGGAWYHFGIFMTFSVHDAWH